MLVLLALGGVMLPAQARALLGLPQAVDPNRTSAPPEVASVPPFSPALRDDVPAGARWLARRTLD